MQVAYLIYGLLGWLMVTIKDENRYLSFFSAVVSDVKCIAFVKKIDEAGKIV